MIKISNKKIQGALSFYQVDFISSNSLEIGWHPLKVILDEDPKYITAILEFENSRNNNKEVEQEQTRKIRTITQILDYIKYKQEIYFYVEFQEGENCFISQKELTDNAQWTKVLDFYENHVIKQIIKCQLNWKNWFKATFVPLFNLADHLQSTFYSNKTKAVPFRKQQLSLLIKGLQEMRDEICEAIYQDLGRCRNQSEMAEISSLLGSARHDFKNVDQWVKDEKVDIPLSLCPASAYVHYEPLGVILIYGSWNYPLFTTFKPLIQSITTGNCALIKPSEISSNSSKVMKKLVETYLDQDCYRVMEGGMELAISLSAQKFDGIVFTGSTQKGKLVAEAASKNLVPCILELGGKCPLVLSENTDLDTACAKTVFGKFTNSGQTCIAPDYVLCHESKLDGYLSTLKEYLKPFDSKGSENQGKLINDFHFNRIKSMIEAQKSKVVIGGSIFDQKNRHIEPTVILNPDMNSEMMQEEIFGPILPIIVYKDFSFVLQTIKSLGKPLAIYYMGHPSDQNFSTLISCTSSGSVSCNEILLQVSISEMSFGGVGDSGYGRYMGLEGFKQLSNRKGVLKKGKTGKAVLKFAGIPLEDKKMKYIRMLVNTGVSQGVIVRWLVGLFGVFVAAIIMVVLKRL